VSAVAASPARAGRAGAWSTLLLLAGLSLVWGLNWPAMKVVLAEVPVLTFRTLCLWITGPVLLILARLGGEAIRLPRQQWRGFVLTALCNVTAWYFGTAMALTLIPAGRAALLAYTFPLWVALLSAFLLRERLSPRQLAGLVLGMAGVAVLIAPNVQQLQTAPVGAAFVLFAALGWAIGTVLMKFYKFEGSVAQITGWQLVIGGAPIALAATLYDPPLHLLALDGRTQLVLVYIIALPMVFGQWAWFKSLSRLSGTVAAIASLAVPAVGLISSALVLGEALGLSEIAALIFVVAALALVLVKSDARPKGALSDEVTGP
jgi:drug/metabolite transporter (DMT)-like permease